MERKKILLVDDSSTTLMMEKMILNQGSFEVITAVNGEEAVQRAIDEKPDLILLDIVMPVMDGFEACRKLREAEETSATPIIMVTTRGEVQNIEQAYSAGCNDYVTKPISGLELMTKIKSLLSETTAA